MKYFLVMLQGFPTPRNLFEGLDVFRLLFVIGQVIIFFVAFIVLQRKAYKFPIVLLIALLSGIFILPLAAVFLMPDKSKDFPKKDSDES